MKVWILMHSENEDYGVEESFRLLDEKPIWTSYQSMWEYITREIEEWEGHPEAEVIDDKLTNVYLVDGDGKELWYYIISQEIES